MTLAATATETDEAQPGSHSDANQEETTGSTARPASNGPSELPKDAIFGLLSVERRRHVLQYLDDHEGTATLGEVADRIASLENDVEECQVTSSQRKRVYVALYQSHLPKLADADVIAYDQDRGTLALGENAEQLIPYLHFEPAETRSGFFSSDFLGVSEISARVKESIVY